MTSLAVEMQEKYDMLVQTLEPQALEALIAENTAVLHELEAKLKECQLAWVKLGLELRLAGSALQQEKKNQFDGMPRTIASLESEIAHVQERLRKFQNHAQKLPVKSMA